MRINRRQLAASVATIPFVNTTRSFAQSTPMSSPVDSSDVEMAEASSRITGLGQYVPGGLLDAELSLGWVDVERQLFTIARGTEGEERRAAFAQSTFGYIPEYFSNVFRLKELVGFDDADILESMSSGLVPGNVQLTRLKIAASDLVPFWLEQGYEEKEAQFGTLWTIGEEAEVDLTHPIQRVLISQFNNIAIVDERIIAFAPTAAAINNVMLTANGNSPSVLDSLDSVTAALPETAVGAWYLDGSRLVRTPGNATSPELEAMFEDQIVESNEAVGEMPVIRTVCIGTTQGASRDEALHEDSSVAFILLETEGDPAQVADVVEWRMDNMMSAVSGQPYAELIGEVEMEPVSESVLRITSQQGASRATFTQMVQQNDSMLFSF